ncbi:MAG: HEAT repeat domain-containing protein, partial [Limisphaerales bacterium]
MKTASLFRFLVILFLSFTAANLFANEEEDLIATLQSTAGATQKWAACQKLRVMGTARAVPALAALLTDEHLSQAARYVLEALPSPEATTALRDALGKTSGLLKAGVVDSLGWRGDAGMVSSLTPLLSDPDPNIAGSAATALGRIGGQKAVAALSAARDHAGPAVESSVLEALLKCADRMAAGNDSASALATYRALDDAKYPVQIRIAAWRGLASADAEHRGELMLKALAGTDRPVQLIALQLLRQSSDRELIQACVARWDSLPPESQLAVMDAQVKLGAEALPTVRAASRSADLRLRVAAWQAFGELNDARSIPALAQAAATGQAPERAAARESLERLHGRDISEALLAEVATAASPEKAEILRALGGRGDSTPVRVLLENAASTDQPVRLAALDALSKLAPPEAAQPLLEMAAHTKSDDERGPVLTALYAVCNANAGRPETSHKLVGILGAFPVAERLPLLQVLAQLGT